MMALAERVYPRVCGGTLETPPAAAGGAGLSPRVRGNPRSPKWTLGMAGSIPACAGEPTCRAGRRATDRVYPRVCGGTDAANPLRVQYEGLSPRVRGNRDHVAEQLQQAGSIPACAGEPSAGGRRLRAAGVYPRVCGGTAG